MLITVMYWVLGKAYYFFMIGVLYTVHCILLLYMYDDMYLAYVRVKQWRDMSCIYSSLVF